VSSESIDLARWGLEKPAAAQPAAPAAKAPVFSDTPLPAITLPDIPLRANVRIDRLAVPGLPPLSAVKAEIQLEPDRLVVAPLSLAVAGGQLQGRLELAARRGEPLRVKLRAQGDGLSLQTLDAISSGDDRVRGGRVNLRANLELAGRTPHGLASSANGSVLVSVADATVLGNAAVMQRDILVTVMKALLPRQEVEQSLKVECAVVNLSLRNGVASIDRSIAMETDKLAVAASGELNLVAQTVALTFRPAAKKGLGLDPANLASMAMLEGPLHDPRVAIDVKGTAREAASIGAAVATAGLTLVGKRLLSGPADTQVCRHAMAGAAAP
ncbi:MAG TPA: AsmA-like C-terminal region-containing protein, partial [Burkholderiaceae bacterium]|nr:AsmA-like C-terminal region-containing protein [Burkholderiaceae bacterium]